MFMQICNIFCIKSAYRTNFVSIMYFLQKFNAVEKLEIFRKTERNKPKNFYIKIKILACERALAGKILEGADKGRLSKGKNSAKVQGIKEKYKKRKPRKSWFSISLFWILLLDESGEGFVCFVDVCL